MPLAVDFQGGLTSAWSNVITFVPKLLAALVILLVGYFVAKAIAGILNKVLERVGLIGGEEVDLDEGLRALLEAEDPGPGTGGQPGDEPGDKPR